MKQSHLLIAAAMLVVFGVAALFIVLRPAELQPPSEGVRAYFSTLEVHSDGSLAVEEKLRVHVKQGGAAKAVVRRFPIAPVDPRTQTFRPMLSISKFFPLRGDEVQPFDIRLTDTTRDYVIASGDASPSSGARDYTLRYQVHSVVIREANERDFLFTAVSPGWEAPIEAVGIDVVMPSVEAVAGAKVFLWSNGKDAASAFTVTKQQEKIIIRSNQPVQVPQGLILAVR
ncbi:MAG: DUF2207 domain-containing protein, partial [Bdellovibrionales bacterium]|nr:DUF2207 domain-containing protein [Bdellovibrionales bacterium]